MHTLSRSSTCSFPCRENTQGCIIDSCIGTDCTSDECAKDFELGICRTNTCQENTWSAPDQETCDGFESCAWVDNTCIFESSEIHAVSSCSELSSQNDCENSNLICSWETSGHHPWSMPQLPGWPVCSDNANGNKDRFGHDCQFFTRFPGMCGLFDDNGFDSETLCCACGGGSDTTDTIDIPHYDALEPFSGTTPYTTPYCRESVFCKDMTTNSSCIAATND